MILTLGDNCEEEIAWKLGGHEQFLQITNPPE